MPGQGTALGKCNRYLCVCLTCVCSLLSPFHISTSDNLAPSNFSSSACTPKGRGLIHALLAKCAQVYKCMFLQLLQSFIDRILCERVLQGLTVSVAALTIPVLCARCTTTSLVLLGNLWPRPLLGSAGREILAVVVGGHGLWMWCAVRMLGYLILWP